MCTIGMSIWTFKKQLLEHLANKMIVFRTVSTLTISQYDAADSVLLPERAAAEDLAYLGFSKRFFSCWEKERAS